MSRSQSHVRSCGVMGYGLWAMGYGLWAMGFPSCEHLNVGSPKPRYIAAGIAGRTAANSRIAPRLLA